LNTISCGETSRSFCILREIEKALLCGILVHRVFRTLDHFYLFFHSFITYTRSFDAHVILYNRGS
jgi:hypothetical protein